MGKRKGKVRFLTKKAYLVAAMAAVLMLAFGMTAVGGEHYVMNMVHSILQGKTQTVMNSEEEAREYSEKDELFAKIDKEFGIDMVELIYIPDGFNFNELNIEHAADWAYFTYTEKEGGWIHCYVYVNQSDRSAAVYHDGELLGEEQLTVSDAMITISEYQGADSESYYEATFTYNDVNYRLMSNVGESEFKKIVENLFFY